MQDFAGPSTRICSDRNELSCEENLCWLMFRSSFHRVLRCIKHENNENIGGYTWIYQIHDGWFMMNLGCFKKKSFGIILSNISVIITLH